MRARCGWSVVGVSKVGVRVEVVAGSYTLLQKPRTDNHATDIHPAMRPKLPLDIPNTHNDTSSPNINAPCGGQEHLCPLQQGGAPGQGVAPL